MDQLIKLKINDINEETVKKKKYEPNAFRQALIKILEEINTIKSEVVALHKEQRIFFNKYAFICEALCEHVKKMSETNQNVDQTLINVLMAIRQNEYLQSWRPQPSGYTDDE
jgi:hypothetical protein